MDLPLPSQPRGDRVRDRTPPHVNARIDARTEACLREVERGGRYALLGRRADLEREWDVDRALMAHFAVVGGTVFALGASRMRRQRGAWNPWLTLFSVQLGFLFLHAARGGCPPVAVLRRLGFRTQKEIAGEREALDRALPAGAQAA